MINIEHLKKEMFGIAIVTGELDLSQTVYRIK